MLEQILIKLNLVYLIEITIFMVNILFKPRLDFIFTIQTFKKLNKDIELVC